MSFEWRGDNDQWQRKGEEGYLYSPLLIWVREGQGNWVKILYWETHALLRVHQRLWWIYMRAVSGIENCIYRNSSQGDMRIDCADWRRENYHHSLTQEVKRRQQRRLPLRTVKSISHAQRNHLLIYWKGRWAPFRLWTKLTQQLRLDSSLDSS